MTADDAHLLEESTLMPELSLTAARRRALLVVAEGDRTGSRVLRTDHTTDLATRPLSVHWKACNWLVTHGLATEADIDDVRLTPAGRVLAGKETARAKAKR